MTTVAADAAGFAGGFSLGCAISGGFPTAGAACGTLLGGACSGAVKEMWQFKDIESVYVSNTSLS